MTGHNCIKCGINLSDENWYFSDQEKKWYVCKKCRYIINIPRQKEFRRKNRLVIAKKARDNKQILMKELKINGCAICGYNKCDAALDFHHVNSEDKEFGVRYSTASYGFNRIIDEVNKCILLCANCHRELHAKERSK